MMTPDDLAELFWGLLAYTVIVFAGGWLFGPLVLQPALRRLARWWKST
ncbi:hypothetical protein [Actinomadura rayongensis]|uniref:Uncharacterized protein n=1 Tax=Actinomadura rayongensis TaxID=1429076 RepID=A0A6I4W5Z6_9ACTN|nr:hypothetical protein [Actinomadura rayongensis]MXQ65597.1 hypothetical protein [Actinomadura rayongensis]